MKYCQNCGHQVDDAAFICINCGCQVGSQRETNKSDTNGMAIAGFVCSFFIPLLGWIFGGIGLSKSRKMNGKGKGFSIAAIVIATINSIVSVILYSNLYSSLIRF